MARKLRVQFEGAIYHVTLRGVERRAIFTEDKERHRFLDRLADGAETHDVRIYLYVLMRNHAHLVVETPRANLDRFMHGLTTAYSVYFNLRHGRSGHLFQGRYGAVLVDGDEYLLRLSRYLHLNPIHTSRAKKLPAQERIRELNAYPWSSYQSYTGKVDEQDFVDYVPMLGMFSGRTRTRQQAYRRFVESGVAQTDKEFCEILKESSLAIGSEEFVGHIKRVYDGLLEGHRSKEDVSFRRIGKTLDSDDVLECVCRELAIDKADVQRQRKGSCVRAVAARMLCQYAGLTQREAAVVIGVSSGAAVCLLLKRFKELVAMDKRLNRKVRRIEKLLAEAEEGNT